MKYDAATIAKMHTPPVPDCSSERAKDNLGHHWKTTNIYPSEFYTVRIESCRHCKVTRKVSDDLAAGCLAWYFDHGGKPVQPPAGYPPHPGWRDTEMPSADDRQHADGMAKTETPSYNVDRRLGKDAILDMMANTTNESLRFFVAKAGWRVSRSDIFGPKYKKMAANATERLAKALVAMDDKRNTT